MGVMTKIVDMLSGGVAGDIIDAVKDYFPPSMTDAEKRDFELKLMQVAAARDFDLMKLANETEAEFNQRIRDLEGTAADLKTIPVIGPLVIFIRGCQRPAFGIFTLIMDWLVFSGAWSLPADSRLESAFFIVNLLVLGFLFGERAVQNVAPLFERMMTAKK